MAVISGAPLLTREKAAGGFQINRSVRFASGDSCKLTKSFSSNGDSPGKKFTISFWFKPGKLQTFRTILGAGTGGSRTYLCLDENDRLRYDGGGQNLRRPNAMFTDASAWYHVVMAQNTPSANVGARCKMYINGHDVRDSSDGYFSDYTFTQNDAMGQFGEDEVHEIGRNTESGAEDYYFDGHLAEFHYVDGTVYDATKFGEFDDADNWNPIKVTGVDYGTNGWYLAFKTNSLGTDTSGKSNNFTVHNLSTSNGVGQDWSYDSPTNYGTDTGVGGEVGGNYGVWEPWASLYQTTIDAGNKHIKSSNTSGCTMATMMPRSGKWYVEFTPTVDGNEAAIGVGTWRTHHESDWPGEHGYIIGWHKQSGNVMLNNSNESTGDTWSTSNVLGVAWDVDAGKIWFRKDATWINSGNPATGANPYQFAAANRGEPCTVVYRGQSDSEGYLNPGDQPFANSAPSGFKALVSTNLPDLARNANEGTAISYKTGSGSITGLKFQPEVVAFKRQNAQGEFAIYSSVRGVQKRLNWNKPDAEETETDGLTAFNADGYTYGSDAGTGTSGAPYHSFAWDVSAGGGTSVASGKSGQTDSANTTTYSLDFGTELMTYTGDGGSGSKYGHNLGKKPHFGIIKNYGGSGEWKVFHHHLTGDNDMLTWNRNYAKGAGSWDTDEMDAGVFQPCRSGDTYLNNSSTNYEAWLFTEVEGFSAFGSYTANGEDKHCPFMYMGFRPRLVWVKSSSHTEQPILFFHDPDTGGEWFNQANYSYRVAQDGQLQTNAPKWHVGANGIGRHGQDGVVNSAGKSYVWGAWASNPFKTARAH